MHTTLALELVPMSILHESEQINQIFTMGLRSDTSVNMRNMALFGNDNGNPRTLAISIVHCFEEQI